MKEKAPVNTLPEMAHHRDLTWVYVRGIVRCLKVFIIAIMIASTPKSVVAETTYVFGVNPWNTPEALRGMFRPLLDYLKEQTGIAFRISISPSYEQLTADMNSGYVQIGTISPSAYLKAKAKYPNLRYLATVMKPLGNSVRDYYLGYIIVRKDSKYRTIEDLRGRTLAFVELDSTSGYKVPAGVMAQMGIDPKSYFKKYFFVGNHDEVIKAVKNRSVDAGATSDTNLESAEKIYGNIFRVVLKTPPIPNECWLAGKGVPPEIAEKIKTVLLGINENTRTADGRVVMNLSSGIPNVRWSERDEAFYDNAAPLLLYGEK